MRAGVQLPGAVFDDDGWARLKELAMPATPSRDSAGFGLPTCTDLRELVAIWSHCPEPAAANRSRV